MDFMQAQVMMQGEGAGRGRELVSAGTSPTLNCAKSEPEMLTGPLPAWWMSSPA